MKKPVGPSMFHVGLCLCVYPSEYSETNYSWSVPKWPGSEMEVEIACGSVDRTWVNRWDISAQTFIHLTQLMAVLVFAVYLVILTVVAIWLLSRVQLFVTPWTAARQASLFFTISLSLLKLMSIELSQ